MREEAGKMVKKAAPVQVEICLYGTMQIGHGYLAAAPEGTCPIYETKMAGKRRTRAVLLGDGSPHPGRSCTEAVWLACQELIEAGCPRDAIATVFMPGGEKCATAPIGNMPAFGDLKWGPAPVYTLGVK